MSAGREWGANEPRGRGAGTHRVHRLGNAGLFGVFAVCLAMTVGMVGEALHPSPDSSTSGAVTAGLFFAAITVGSAYVLYRRLARARMIGATALKVAELDREQRILHVAEKSGGRITLAEIAAHANLSVADVEETMAALEREGTVISRVSSQGAVVYFFPGLTKATPAIDDA